MKDITIPVSVVGPGSQPEGPDELKNDFMNMPDEMMTYSSPMVPEAEDIGGLEPALARAYELLDALGRYRAGDMAEIIELDDLDDANRQFFDQLLGEGEVSVQCNGNINAMIQESMLAGVWRVQYMDDMQTLVRDTIEVAHIPSIVQVDTFKGAAKTVDLSNMVVPDTVYNAPPLLAEIRDKLLEWKPEDGPHIINLSLLPHTEEDLVFLSDKLGIGDIIILSRGYGNCRISSTRTNNVWWVQYFNSQETLILNTMEINIIPEVACASTEDLEESRERLAEILVIYE